MDVFYLGARPTQHLSRTLLESGCRLLHIRYAKGFLERAASTSGRAVVLHWKSNANRRIIAEAKASNVPVLVIAADLNAAIQAGAPFADLYLEKPARDEELVSFVLDLVSEAPMRRAAASVA